jgi:hypothetical protein
MCRKQLDVHRSTGHERGLWKSEALTTDKESSPLSTCMLYFTAAFPVLGKKPVLVRSQTGDFRNVQEATGMFIDLVGMRDV